MKITRKKILEIIKEEIKSVVSEAEGPGSRKYTELTKQLAGLDPKIRSEWAGWIKSIEAEPNFKNKKQSDPDSAYTFLANQLIAFLKQKQITPKNEPADAKAASPGAQKQTNDARPQESAQKIVANVTSRFKGANQEAVKKIVELQTMLVKLKLAPDKLPNGKPFVDGIFGQQTGNALKKIYRR